MYVVRRVPYGSEYLRADGEIFTTKIGEAIDEEKARYCYLDPDMLQALADELAKKGIKPQQGYLEGKLEAMENHLDDCRHLLKLDQQVIMGKPINTNSCIKEK